MALAIESLWASVHENEALFLFQSLFSISHDVGDIKIQ